jgi:hypothetical protein
MPGKMDHLRLTVVNDRLKYPKTPVKWAVNHEPECKEKRGLKQDYASFVLFVHPSLNPFVYESDKNAGLT